MPKKPKDIHTESLDVDDTLAEDQRSHGYYYDDAYGYEEYRPEDDEEDEGEANGDDRDTDAV